MKNFENTKGFSLMEVMVSIGIMSIVSLGVTSLLVKTNQEVKKANVKLLANSILVQVQSYVKNDRIWSSSRNNSGNANSNGSNGLNNTQNSFYCLDNPGVCTKTAKHFVLYSSSGSLNSNLTSTATDPDLRGFDLNGLPCSSYDAVNGNDNCPFGLTLTFTPLCAGNSCSSNNSTAIRIDGSLKYKPNSSNLKMAMNESFLKFSLLRHPSAVESDVERICEEDFAGNWLDGICHLNTQSICESLFGVWGGNTCTSLQSSAGTCSSIGGVWTGIGNGQSACVIPALTDTCKELGGTPEYVGVNSTFSCANLSYNTVTNTNGNSEVKKICEKLGGVGTFSSASLNAAASCDLSGMYATSFETTCKAVSDGGNGGRIVADASVLGGKYCIWDDSVLDTKLKNFCEGLDQNILGTGVSASTGLYDANTKDCSFSMVHAIDNIKIASDVKKVFSEDFATPNTVNHTLGSARCQDGYYMQGFDSNGVPICFEYLPYVCTPTWAPSPENTCTTGTITQTDGCGGSQTVSGTKVCSTCSTTSTPQVYNLTSTPPSPKLCIGQQYMTNLSNTLPNQCAETGALVCESSAGAFVSRRSIGFNNSRWLNTCVCSTYLGTGTHTESDCTTDGGVVKNAESGVKVCAFPADFTNPAFGPCIFTEGLGGAECTNICPTGWSKYSGWMETADRTCNENPDSNDVANCGITTCTATGQNWSNHSIRNTCNYQGRQGLFIPTPTSPCGIVANIACRSSYRSMGCH
ncbi:MAG: type II secretion system protein [Bdellovibrionaceae bacterium]|jgi:prepilin-type N-terminal cleavage/methylation domain-containing protein|nr:type II secretion system protein [Pseudobdellovibrionaceae bacterium]